jgi:hypothetical protein
VQYAYLLEAYMIAKGHLDDFANGRGVKEFAFHKMGNVIAQ